MFGFLKKLVITTIIFALILSSTAISSCNVDLKEKHTMMSLDLLDFDIVIPNDFPTIQEGVDHADSGNVILVREGIYKEHLFINKTSLTIIGADKYNTILDGCKTNGQGIVVRSENVVIKNLTITNFKDGSRDEIFSYDHAGVELQKANATIENNRFIDNGVGIELFDTALNTTIINNEMINDGLLIGNYYQSSDFPNLTPLCFVHNINNNTVNGKPLYYFKDQKDFTVPTDAGQITMVNCTNFTIKNIHMSNNDFSILLAFCYDSLIENITITHTSGESLLFACENITIQNNIIVDTFKAICLEYKSKNNIVRNNDISKNYVGISLFNNASNNLIYNNKVYSNRGPMSAGIEIVSYHGGTQQENNISKNEIYNNPIGIRFRENTTNTTVYLNNITDNMFGMFMELFSDNNNIIYNNFRKNIIQAFFNGCSENNWENNYWNRPRFLPKAIFGFKPVGKMEIPYVNFDKNPALKSI